MTQPREDLSSNKGELTLSTVTEVLAALAAVTGLIYVTGGAVLALRLAFVNLPALGVVGQLPHGFLFSIGASQVVVPALAIGTLHVIYVAHRSTAPGDRPSVWDTARKKKLTRWRHLILASLLPVLLILPGTVLALARDTDTRPLAFVVGGAALIAAWYGRGRYVRKTDGIKEGDEVDPALLADEPKTLGLPRFYLPVLAGSVLFLVIAVAAAVLSDWDFRFLWLVAAWAACVPAVLGYLVLRGTIGDNYRDDGDKKHLVRAQIVLSLAVAGLAVPGLVCFWAAWRLESATVCTTAADATGSTFVAGGVLVGETGDRVYVGDTRAKRHSIVSVPQSKITRTVIGGASDAAASCPAQPPASPDSG